MNYLDIILQGYFSENNREHLKNYFLRECKKAEKEYYSAGEFYSGCLKVIEHYEHQIKKQYYERKKEIYFVLNNVDKGIIDIGKDDPKEVKERWRQELESLNKNDFSVTLPAGGHLWNKGITYIKNAILEAQNNSEPQPEKKQSEEPPENPHSFIFPNGKCWQFFSYWKDNAADIKADLCFAYWQMKYDSLMNDITPTQYINWLNDKLDIDFNDYWKQLHRLNNPRRMQNYSIAKKSFNL